MQDIVIIGGGVAGLGAAMTLGSCQSQELKTLVLDSGNSDLLRAKLYNVPFLEQGTPGTKALQKLKEDTLAFERVAFKTDTVMSIEGSYENFTINTKTNTYKARIIVLASGCQALDIKLNGNSIPTSPHLLMPRPGKIQVSTKGRQELEEGIYVAGLLSGVTSMYAVALGSGVEAACAILSKLAKKVTIVHDFEGSRGES